MKRLVTAAIVITIAFVGYRYYNRSYAPVKQYEQFAAAPLTRRFAPPSPGGRGLWPIDSLLPREKVPEGRMRGRRSCTRQRRSLARAATRPAMYAKLNQIVSLRKTASGWKVTAFENKFDSMDSLSAR